MKYKLLKFFGILCLALTLNMAMPNAASAQCPMCRMSAESNLKNGGTDGRGLNNGIMYMLATPYVMVAVIGFIWWRNRKDEEDEMIESL